MGGDVMKTAPYVVCPLCGHNRKLEWKKGRIKWEWDGKRFIYIRDVSGGKIGGTGAKGRGKAPSKGFPIIETLDISGAVASGYGDVVLEVADALIKVIRVFIDEGIISKDDI